MKRFVIYPVIVLVFVMMINVIVAYNVLAAPPSAKASTADGKPFEVPVGQTVTKSIKIMISDTSFNVPFFYDIISDIYVEASNDNIVNVTKVSMSGDGLTSKNTVVTFGVTVKGNKAGNSSLKLTISSDILSSSSDIHLSLPIVVKEETPVTINADMASGVSSEIAFNTAQTKNIIISLDNGTFTGNAETILKAIGVSASNKNISVSKSGTAKLTANNKFSFNVSINGAAEGNSAVKINVPSSVTTASGTLSSSVAVSVKGKPPVQAAPGTTISVDSFKVKVGETSKNTVVVTLTNGESIKSGVTPTQLLNAISITGNNKNISSKVVLSNCRITDSTHFRFDMTITGKAVGASSTKYLSQGVINKNVLTVSSANLALPQVISVTVTASDTKAKAEPEPKAETEPKAVVTPPSSASLSLNSGGYGVMYKGDTRSNKVTVILTNTKLKSGTTVDSLLGALTIITDGKIISDATKANAVVVSENTFTFDLGIKAVDTGNGMVSVQIDGKVLTTGNFVETPKTTIEIKTETILTQADFSILNQAVELSKAFKTIDENTISVSNAKINSLQAVSFDIPESLAKLIENPKCIEKDGSIYFELSLKEGVPQEISKLTGDIGVTIKKDGITPNKGYAITQDIKMAISVSIIPSVSVSTLAASMDTSKEKVAVSKVSFTNAAFKPSVKVSDISTPILSGDLASYVNVTFSELNAKGFQVNIRLNSKYPNVPAEGIEGKISILILQEQIVPNDGVISTNIVAEFPLKLTNQGEVDRIAEEKRAEEALYIKTLSLDFTQDKTSGAISARYTDKSNKALAEWLKAPDYALRSPVIKVGKLDTKQLTLSIPQKYFTDIQLLSEMSIPMAEAALSIKTSLFDTEKIFDNIEFKVTATDKTTGLAMSSISNKRPIYEFEINIDGVPMQEVDFRDKVKASINYKVVGNENVGVMLVNKNDEIVLMSSDYNSKNGVFTFNLNRLGTYFIGNIESYEDFKKNTVSSKSVVNTAKPGAQNEQPVYIEEATPVVESIDADGSTFINLDQNNLSIIKSKNMDTADQSDAKITLHNSLFNLVVPPASVNDIKVFGNVVISFQECVLKIPTSIFGEVSEIAQTQISAEKIKEPSILAHRSLSNGRPVYNFNISSNGYPVTSQVIFNQAAVSIKYTKSEKEKTQIKVGVFYVDNSGKLTFVKSEYDDAEKAFKFNLIGNGTYFIGNSSSYE